MRAPWGLVRGGRFLDCKRGPKCGQPGAGVVRRYACQLEVPASRFRRNRIAFADSWEGLVVQYPLYKDQKGFTEVGEKEEFSARANNKRLTLVCYCATEKHMPIS